MSMEAGLARTTDPDTSHDAADRVKQNLAQLQAMVYACLERHPAGLTDEEVQREIEMYPSTQRGRRNELVRLGRVEWAGTKRQTRTGAWSRVWRVKQ